MLEQFSNLEVLVFHSATETLSDPRHVDVYVLGLDDMGEAESAFLQRLRETDRGNRAGVTLCSAKTEEDLVTAFETHDFDSFVSKDWVSPAQMYLAVTAALRSARWRMNHKCALHGVANLLCTYSDSLPSAAE
ncbi:hypothetical protein [Donghicola sp. XS_ASV15]|uniref:hypothetical protein n=1 Tax=Donghicola sp. XS_ASV15 TaxID=3241295 RepID=UPI003516A2DD